MDEIETFKKASKMVRFVDFDKDIYVSVFETNIRIIGSLLSSHIFSTKDPRISSSYTGHLLSKAVDLADRILPAFDTKTGLPYGTINLKRGVNPHESTLTCTACAGTFHIEFSWLSLLSGDDKYERVSRKAITALFNSRSKIGLFGTHSISRSDTS